MQLLNLRNRLAVTSCLAWMAMPTAFGASDPVQLEQCSQDTAALTHVSEFSNAGSVYYKQMFNSSVADGAGGTTMTITFPPEATQTYRTACESDDFDGIFLGVSGETFNCVTDDDAAISQPVTVNVGLMNSCYAASCANIDEMDLFEGVWKDLELVCTPAVPASGSAPGNTGGGFGIVGDAVGQDCQSDTDSLISSSASLVVASTDFSNSMVVETIGNQLSLVFPDTAFVTYSAACSAAGGVIMGIIGDDELDCKVANANPVIGVVADPDVTLSVAVHNIVGCNAASCYDEDMHDLVLHIWEAMGLECSEASTVSEPDLDANTPYPLDDGSSDEDGDDLEISSSTSGSDRQDALDKINSLYTAAGVVALSLLLIAMFVGLVRERRQTDIDEELKNPQLSLVHGDGNSDGDDGDAKRIT